MMMLYGGGRHIEDIREIVDDVALRKLVGMEQIVSDDFAAGGSLRETSDVFADKDKVSWVWLTYGKEKLEKAYPKLCLRRSIYKKRRKAKKHS